MRNLERRLDLKSVVAISISAMMGSGIFVLPGLTAAYTGPTVWLAYVLAGICILPAAISKSELATAMPTSGGTYIYLERTFGPLAGTISGLGLWLSILLKSAFALVGFGAYLAVFTDSSLKITSLSLLVVIVSLNIIGAGKISKAAMYIISFVIVFLVVLALWSGVDFQPERLTPLFPSGVGGLLSATGFVFVSFAGVTKVAAIAEEIKNPGKNLPQGILISLLIVTLLYALLSLAFVGNFEMSQFKTDLRPVYTLANQLGGSVFGAIAAIIGILTMTSMANVGLLAGSRFPFAMARDRLLPSFLGVLHPKLLTPIYSIFLSGLIIAATIFFLEIEKIVKIASAFMIIIYVAESVAVIVLRETRVQWYKPIYRSFAYPWIQLFGIFSCLILLAMMGVIVLSAILGAIFIGGSVYLLYGRYRVDRKGVVGFRGRRIDLMTENIQLTDENDNDESYFFDQAAAVIALFGKERSPEVLLELASGLVDKGKVEIVHLTEVPEQTVLADVGLEGSVVKSLRRRFRAMSVDKDLLVEFEPVVSHDIFQTVYDISNRLHCDWLVKEWGGHSRGTFTIHNQMGWLEDHLACNVATFRDAGVRYFRKILVLVEQGPHNSLLLKTSAHLAGVHGAELSYVRFVPMYYSEKRVAAEKAFLKESASIYSHFTDCLVLPAVDVVSTMVSLSGDYDLIIMGATHHKDVNLYQRMFGTQIDKITYQASCSVIRIQTAKY